MKLRTPAEYESLRLSARQWRTDDSDLLLAVEKDTGFKSFCYPPSYDLSTAEKRNAFVKSKRETFAKHRTCKFPVFLKASGDFIGLIGIEPFERNGQMAFELGYRLLESHWGNGYSKELSAVLIESFFRVRPGETLGALVHLDNLKSLALTESLGFKRENQFEHNGSTHWWLSYKSN